MKIIHDEVSGEKKHIQVDMRLDSNLCRHDISSASCMDRVESIAAVDELVGGSWEGCEQLGVTLNCGCSAPTAEANVLVSSGVQMLPRQYCPLFSEEYVFIAFERPHICGR